MILDSQQQRAFLLEMFRQVTFPGALLDTAYEIKAAIAGAQIAPAQPEQEGKA